MALKLDEVRQFAFDATRHLCSALKRREISLYTRAVDTDEGCKEVSVKTTPYGNVIAEARPAQAGGSLSEDSYYSYSRVISFPHNRIVSLIARDLTDVDPGQNTRTALVLEDIVQQGLVHNNSLELFYLTCDGERFREFHHEAYNRLEENSRSAVESVTEGFKEEVSTKRARLKAMFEKLNVPFVESADLVQAKAKLADRFWVQGLYADLFRPPCVSQNELIGRINKKIFQPLYFTSQKSNVEKPRFIPLIEENYLIYLGASRITVFLIR